MDPHELTVSLGDSRTTALTYQAASTASPSATLILAHGAGAPQRHPFMIAFARGLSERGIDVVTFNFLYTEQRRKVPDRMPQLIACFRAVIDAVRGRDAPARERLFIGGKSMGGRAATHVAADDHALRLDGLILLGYPLHPPGRPDQLRDAHLSTVQRPMLFVQGSRDTFGTPSELKPVLASLSPLPTLHHVEGGDHSFALAGAAGKKRQPEVYAEIQNVIAEWIRTV